MSRRSYWENCFRKGEAGGFPQGDDLVGFSRAFIQTGALIQMETPDLVQGSGTRIKGAFEGRTDERQEEGDRVVERWCRFNHRYGYC